ncbi:TetR/AcrR family transcriptional regulator [Allokutzneria sp. A3M-2-11 16]|uniref:TetR/AcrR family transcriptional regulator n=1 Tax=Allokutzneria sp. A3M-2-11 16 TaxID=2962043 RepID=UPI0020B6C489|nr:TetR/AcrR family transcriptional regulator [Allokutzneria sp. A3M-2-11 16]MCP3803545.1 TetR/AcrR family transcriptional regulator [Allokutzneria sp. A3M-2-11 16]
MTSTGRTARGRIDKRKAILDAAFTVFARRGYDQACVQEIADEAGVAKPTVYNHLTDKENLFRHATEAVADAVRADSLAIVERLRDPGDLRAALEEVALGLLRIYSDPRSTALRRLTGSACWVGEALADRFARLCLAGALRQCDPAVAAEQFLALLTGPWEARALRESTVDLRAVVEAGVDTFVRAYGV